MTTFPLHFIIGLSVIIIVELLFCHPLKNFAAYIGYLKENVQPSTFTCLHSWLRELDLNQRPSGCERTNMLKTNENQLFQPSELNPKGINFHIYDTHMTHRFT